MLVNYLFTIEAEVFRKLIQKLKAAKQMNYMISILKYLLAQWASICE
jgi:hypothetical protein